MTSHLSVWLVPSADQDTTLSQRIADIAARTGRPAFAPHATVLGDLEIGAAPLSAMLKDLQASLPVQHLPVTAIRAEPLFFKSLYLDLPQSLTLSRFREALAQRLALGPPPFAPHLSMAYGVLGPQDRDEIDGLGDLIGMSLALGRLQLVHSNQALAPSDWRVLEEFALSDPHAQQR